jgi:hypothetical protein
MLVQHGLLSPLDEQVDFLVGGGGCARSALRRRGRLDRFGFDGNGVVGLPKKHERRSANAQYTGEDRDRLPGNHPPAVRRLLRRAAAVA